MKKLIFPLALLVISCYCFQIEIIDKYYEVLYPPVIEYYTTDAETGAWIKTENTDAPYFRKISYDETGNHVGLIRDYYQDGTLQMKAHASKLEPFTTEGQCTWYHTNGNISKQGHYIKGEKNGIYRSYFKNGQLKFHGNYANDLADGLFKSYTEDGSAKLQRLYVADSLYFTDYFIKNSTDEIFLQKLKKTGKFYKKGNDWLEKGNYDLAIKNFTEAIVLYPNYLVAYELRERCYHYKKEFDRAIHDCEHLLTSKHPKQYIINYRLGDNLLASQKKDEAQKQFATTIAIAPNTKLGKKYKAFSFDNIGYIHLSEKNYLSAAEYYTKAIEIAPTVSFHYSNRAFAFISSKVDSLQFSALNDCNKSIELNAKNSEAYTYRAVIQAQNNNLRAALSDASIALNIDSKNQLAITLHKNLYNSLNPSYNSSSISGEGINWGKLAVDLYFAYSIYETVDDIRNRRWADAIVPPAIAYGLYWFLSKN